MSLFRPPIIEHIGKAAVVLDGGRTRLKVTLSGWGRLVLTRISQDGAGQSIRRLVRGGARTIFVDVLPPCAVTVMFQNPFGTDSSTVSVDSVLPGVDPVSLPELKSIPTIDIGSRTVGVYVPAPIVELPRAPRLRTPSVALGSITIKRFSGG